MEDEPSWQPDDRVIPEYKPPPRKRVEPEAGAEAEAEAEAAAAALDCSVLESMGGLLVFLACIVSKSHSTSAAGLHTRGVS